MRADWKQKIGNSEAGFFHHAFILGGAIDATASSLREFLNAEFGIQVFANQDFTELNYVSFQVDDARFLKKHHSMRPSAAAAKKISVVSAHSFTEEAQNALLKLFEEPSEDSVLFLLCSSEQFFLPTILSRVVVVPGENAADDFGEVPEFLEKSPAARQNLVLAISKNASKDENVKDYTRAQKFLDDFIKYYHQKGLKGKRTREENRALSLALRYREYAHANAPSYKMMIAHLALVI